MLFGAQSTNIESMGVHLDFRGHVEPDVPLHYARKQDFSPILHPVFG